MTLNNAANIVRASAAHQSNGVILSDEGRVVAPLVSLTRPCHSHRGTG